MRQDGCLCDLCRSRPFAVVTCIEDGKPATIEVTDTEMKYTRDGRSFRMALPSRQHGERLVDAWRKRQAQQEGAQVIAEHGHE